MRAEAQRFRLDDQSDAVPRARRLVRELTAGRPAQRLTSEAEIIASELVTNALLHGRPPVELAVSVADDRVRVEVSDHSRLLPVVGLRATEGMTGRGLGLVAALATAWGVESRDAGKVVWAEIELAAVRSPAIADQLDVDALLASWPDLADGPRAERTFTVSLGDVPTDLLLAAKSHVDNLVREFALAVSGAASGSTGAVPGHLAELIDTITSRFAAPRQAIKRQALAAAAAGEERTRLTLTLPQSAAEAGEHYLLALDEVDAYARAARLLTPETPPEHRAFRHWYVNALTQQLRQAANGAPPHPPITFEQHVLGELRDLAVAQRAADRAARLQEVTAALAGATLADEVAAVVVSEGVAALRASGGSLLVPAGDDHLAVPGAVGYPEDLLEQLRTERRSAQLPAATALRTGEAIWLESRQERDLRFPALTGLEPGTASMCAVPLTVGGEILGALRFSFDQPRLFDADERRFVLALAAQTAQALWRAALLRAERAARARTTFLADAMELLTSSLEPRETLEHLTALLVPAFADWAAVYLLDDALVARVTAVAHRDAELAARLREQLIGQQLDPAVPEDLVEVLRTGRAVRHATAVERAAGNLFDGLLDPADARALTPRTGMGVPLAARGAVVGLVVLARTSGEPYAEEDQRLVEDVAARAAVAVQNAQAFARERHTALTLQQGLLPQRPPYVPGARFAWRYLPAGVGTPVGGDWYDVIDLEEGRVALVIGDVMGRGVQAAALMGQLRATARAYASAQLPPAEILTRLDAAVVRLEQAQITTAVFALLDPATRVLTVASAGHLPPLLIPPGEPARYLEVEPGPPLGVGEPEYLQTTVTLPPGAVLLLFTDGLIEARDRPVDEGMRMLREAVSEVTGVEAVCERALAALGHQGRQDDDTALLAVALTGE